MQRDTSTKLVRRSDRHLLSIFCCSLIIAFMWLGVCLNNRPVALAEPMEKRIAEAFDGAIVSQPMVMNNLKNRVRDDLEESDFAIGDLGFADPITGKARSATERADAGQVERNLGHSAKQFEIAEDVVNGRTQENVANIHGKAANSRRRDENAIEDVMRNIKNKVN